MSEETHTHDIAREPASTPPADGAKPAHADQTRPATPTTGDAVESERPAQQIQPDGR